VQALHVNHYVNQICPHTPECWQAKKKCDLKASIPTAQLAKFVQAINLLLSTIRQLICFFIFWKQLFRAYKMNSLLHQFKLRRLFLGLKQGDMMLRVGVSRQQYQRLESKGNPRLNTLELVANGLNGEVMLIPKEKLEAVNAVLEGRGVDLFVGEARAETKLGQKSLADDPWQGLLDDDL
jgi:DNA-binding XRE family transcriptional regulator